MYDFLKLHIRDQNQISRILKVPFLQFENKCNLSTGEVQPYPIETKWKGWSMKIYSPKFMEIKGSLHTNFKKSNANDFSLKEVNQAVKSLCQQLRLNSRFANIVNVEFGPNFSPRYCASEILSQIICCKNKLPINPFQNTDKGFLLVFKIGDVYIKFYDKGKHCKTSNLLRFEVKGMNARYFQNLGISTLHDLTTKKAALILGKELIKAIKKIVFDDDTIDDSLLTREEQISYLKMKDGKEWAKFKGRKNEKVRRREMKFKRTIKKNGKRNLPEYLAELIESKWVQLTAS